MSEASGVGVGSGLHTETVCRAGEDGLSCLRPDRDKQSQSAVQLVQCPGPQAVVQRRLRETETLLGHGELVLGWGWGFRSLPFFLLLFFKLK